MKVKRRQVSTTPSTVAIKSSEDEGELFFNYCNSSRILTSLLSMAHGRLEGGKKNEKKTNEGEEETGFNDTVDSGKSSEDDGELF